MSIRKAFSRLNRTNIVTNNVNETAENISATKITSGGYNYYVYLNPAPAESFVLSGRYAISRQIKGGFIGFGNEFGNVDVFVAAGGGGGGGGDGMGEGGGGGAGGVRYFPNVPVPSSLVSLQVGNGGAPIGSFAQTISGDGQPSFFGPLYISYGGGGGGSGDVPPPGFGSGRHKAGQGGSGGGSGSMGRPGPPSGGGGPAILWAAEAGQGNIPPTSPPQGNPGVGGYQPGPTAQQNLGGGGGASGIGGSGFPAPQNANGGAGAPFPAFPAPVLAPAIPAPLQPRWTPAVGPTGLFGGGGGGGRAPAPDPSLVALGGPGGGGTSGGHPSNAGQPGANHTGGGGGGSLQAGQGGTGIIILRKTI